MLILIYTAVHAIPFRLRHNNM